MQVQKEPGDPRAEHQVPQLLDHVHRGSRSPVPSATLKPLKPLLASEPALLCFHRHFPRARGSPHHGAAPGGQTQGRASLLLCEAAKYGA